MSENYLGIMTRIMAQKIMTRIMAQKIMTRIISENYDLVYYHAKK